MEACSAMNALVIRAPITRLSRNYSYYNYKLMSSLSTRNPVLMEFPSSLSLSSRSSSSVKSRRGWVVEAKGQKVPRQFQRAPQPSLSKLEDDGNPKFVIFIRAAKGAYLWFPLSVVTGGTTAKIMVAAKDNFLGKYIYKDTLARNIAAVIYRDEKEIQNSAFKQYRVLRTVTQFRYGYKLVEKNNLKSALSTSDVIELPTRIELKTVLDKVMDSVGKVVNGAKESFGKITTLNATSGDEPETEVKS